MDNKLYKKTFLWMFMGLFVTGLISYFSFETGFMEEYLLDKFNILLILELLVVIVFSFLFKKLSPEVVGSLFIGYAVLNGFTFSTIFYAFELNSIVLIFMGSAVLFLLLGLFGYSTEKDLSSFGRIFGIGLIVGLILTLINLFLQNSMLDIILSWALLILFCGVTIYDINKMKQLSHELENTDKMHIYFAMQLYLDFINIFIRLLQLFGKER